MRLINTPVKKLKIRSRECWRRRGNAPYQLVKGFIIDYDPQ